MQAESATLPGKREIYKNLQWLEEHELAGVIVMLTSGRGSPNLYLRANRWRIFSVGRKVGAD